MCGTAFADPIMPTGWDCSASGAANCGYAADWVAGVNPGALIDPSDPSNPYSPLYSGPGGPLPIPSDYRAGAVMFWIHDGFFEVWLANISDLDTIDPTHLLTAVLFDIGNGTTENANQV
jgi:hypothetical protein